MMRWSVPISTRRIRRSRGTARSSAITDQRLRRHRDIDRRNCRRSSEAENFPARKALKTLKTGKSTRRRRAQSTMRWSVPTSTRQIGRSRGLARSSAIRRQALRRRRDINHHNRRRSSEAEIFLAAKPSKYIKPRKNLDLSPPSPAFEISITQWTQWAASFKMRSFTLSFPRKRESRAAACAAKSGCPLSRA